MTSDPTLQSDGDDDIVGIASIDGMDKLLGQGIQNAFAESGIKCTLEGSVVYGVLVYRKGAAAAVSILTNDIRFTGKKIRLNEKPCRINVEPGATL